MSIIVKMRRQKAVYWVPGKRLPDGRATWADPVVIDCRWQEDNQVYRGTDGDEHVAAATVYTDRDVELDGALLLSDTAPTTDKNDPLKHGALLIKQFGKIPNLKNTQVLRTAYL